ncbi:hypothetical protein QBC39DRAFT_425927 [Podospora conica]|nr:hypothetical protein QBC39DRAFT_425927 [Schizothecium conicum]
MAAADPDPRLLQQLHELNDVELAALLSLIAREHCLISTPPDAVDDLTEELRLIAARTFGLSSTVVHCHAHTTLDDFANAILLVPPPRASSPNNTRSNSPFQARHHHHDPSPGGSYFPSPRIGNSNTGLTSPSSTSTAAQKHPQIANVVLAKHLDRAPRAVQIQALELMRTRRIFTRTSVQTAPKQFLLVAVLGATSGGHAHVTPHLNDFFYLSHWHDPEDGFDYLEEWAAEDDRADSSYVGGGGVIDEDDDGASTISSTSLSVPRPAVIGEADVALLAQLARQVSVDVDVSRYQMNIVSFLRTHRAVDGGITPTATKHFEQLMRSLAPLHGFDYVTPSLVGMAARKIYLHRIRIVRAEKERSMQWGSELEAIEAVLEGVGAEDVIEDVLGMVAVPK